MAEIRVSRLDQGQTNIRDVLIAVTPEGFWCCPSTVVFQKTLKSQKPLNKPKSSLPPPNICVHKKQIPQTEKKPMNTPIRSVVTYDDQRTSTYVNHGISALIVPERLPRPKVELVPRNEAIEYGEPGTRVDLSYLEIDDCEDVKSYVETVRLMYCKEMKQRLMKQSVSHVLRILKVAELLGFNSCIQSCLEYLEAVPWVGEEEEEKVISSVLRLQGEGIGLTPVLKRISSNVCNPPTETISHLMELVLKGNEERGRREMKSIVLKLLRENNSLPSYAAPADICIETVNALCRSCLDSLLSLFKRAAEPESTDKPTDTKELVVKQIALEADNLSWLLDILADRQSADDLALMWASQQELATLHSKLPIVSRHHVSCITARLFVGIGEGEMLPTKDTSQLLLQTWLQPLINDYNWLQHGYRSFDHKVVEEGIGRTILTLPLEDQQSILLAWLGSFLKAGDKCPNLQRAFEVWWRRTFIRPYTDAQGSVLHSHSSMTLKQ
ncbi:BTB/POZ domain-containing protein [Hibiscus syriacus]|uniref:BTB/POZ domain-containing protein n=1 Tax=Hibiscus syriacus TaxID=106335 RepID=A0A6A3AS15_HIBSY|nr:BTB/POZ domain-containing protein [Hibiscus syriacus]